MPSITLSERSVNLQCTDEKLRCRVLARRKGSGLSFSMCFSSEARGEGQESPPSFRLSSIQLKKNKEQRRRQKCGVRPLKFCLCFLDFFPHFFIFHFQFLKLFLFSFFLCFFSICFCLRFFSFFIVFLFVFACVSFHFLFFLHGSLHSGRSKVTRVTVGRDQS